MTQEEKRLRRQERRLKIRELQELAKGPIDMPFLVLVLMLTVIGLIMLFSASFPSALNKYNDAAYFVIRQARFAAAGVAFMLVMSKINYQRLRGVATFVLLASIVVILLSLILGLLVTLAAAIGILVVLIIKLVFLYRTAMIFRCWPDGYGSLPKWDRSDDSWDKPDPSSLL